MEGKAGRQGRRERRGGGKGGKAGRRERRERQGGGKSGEAGKAAGTLGSQYIGTVSHSICEQVDLFKNK